MDNELDNRVDIYDKLVEDIQSQTPKEMLRDSKKFTKLCDVFDVDVDNMESNIQKMKEQEIELLTPEYNKDGISDLSTVISTDNLKIDIQLIRQNLRANVQAIGTILSKFGTDLIATHADDVSGSVLMGYSELVKSHTTSMKLLIDIHKTAAETLVSVKKLTSEAKDIELEENGGDIITNNIVNFVGTPSQLLESLKNK